MIGIQHWLAHLPSGAYSPDLDIDSVCAWIRKKHWGQAAVDEFGPVDRARRLHCAKLHEYYEGRGDSEMQRLIIKVFSDSDLQRMRSDWIPQAKHVNVLRRLTTMRSTTYSMPARRTVTGEDDNWRYQQLQRACRQHEMARRWCSWGNLHKQLLVGFRTRVTTRGKREPVIDIVPPHRFFAVSSPTDPQQLLGVGIQLTGDSPTTSVNRPPAWLLMTDAEQLFLDADGHYIPKSHEDLGWARMPYVLLTTEPPVSGILDLSPSANAMAAHEMVWFEHILLAKESKSATKITTVTGDVTREAREQAADTERAVMLGDATMQPQDMSMDLEMFRSTANYIYEGAAADHDLPPQLLHHAGVQSAEARELMRAPLMEERRKQEVYWREFERDFSEVQSMVCERELPDMAFALDGWRIDYAESSTPLDPKTRLEVFEQSRRLGLTNTAEELMARNPDLLTIDDAIDALRKHVDVELARNLIMRPLQQVSGEMGAQWADEIDAVGVLIRAGYEPAAAAKMLGVKVPHTGAEPVTLKEASPTPGVADQRARVPPTPKGVRR